MNANVSIQALLINNSNSFGVTIYAASAPTVVVQNIIPTKPYGEPFQVVFTGLTYGVNYILKLWESSDGTPGGTLRNSTNFTANGQSVNIRANMHVYGGDTRFPTAGNTFTDATLAGWDIWIEIEDRPTLDPDTMYTFDDVQLVTFTDGTTTIEGMHMVIHFFPKIGIVQQPSPAIISKGRLVTVDTTLTNADANTDILVQGVNGLVVLNMPVLTTVTDYDIYRVRSEGGSHVNCSIRFPGTDKGQRKTLVSKFVLGQQENIELYKANGVWNTTSNLVGLDRVGTPFISEDVTVINAVEWNGTQSLSKINAERFSDWLNASTGILVNQTSWNTVDSLGNKYNNGKYGTGTSSNWQLPLSTNAPHLRMISGSSSSPGDFFDYKVLDVKHISGLGQGGIGFGEASTGGQRSDYSNIHNGVRDLTSGILDVNGFPISSSRIGTPQPISLGFRIFVWI